MKKLMFAALALLSFWNLNAQAVSEVKGSGIFVVFNEFNPGKNEEWDGELEFQLSFGVIDYDNVKRVWNRSELGRGDEFAIKEGKIDQKARSLVVSTKLVENNFQPNKIAKVEQLFWLGLVDVGFFGDSELVQNEFNLELLPFTKPIRASLADLPRAGRSKPTFAEVIVTIQRRAVADRLEELVPKNSIRWRAKQSWAGADKDYILYAIKMAALYQVLDTYQVSASTVIEDEKTLEVMNELFEQIDKGALNQQLGEAHRKMHRLLGYGLGTAQILSFFGIVDPKDIPSTGEVVVDKVKLLAKAEAYSALSKYHYSKASGRGEDLKEKLSKEDGRGFKDRAKDLYAKARGKLSDLAKATKEKVFRRENEFLPDENVVQDAPEPK